MAASDRLKLQDPTAEAAQAQALAARYRYEYVDLRESSIDHELFRSIPVDLMFRYNFVPLHAQNGTLDIALADPRNLGLIDELALLLNKKLRVKVTTLSQISDLLKKTEQSQRVLEEVTEGFTLDVVGDEENQDETLSIDRLSAADSDIAPVIKLVDTTIFNALERRASDIHIESRDQEVAIKYRIDGVLHYAMAPIAKDWHSTIISRIKVMSEIKNDEDKIITIEDPVEYQVKGITQIPVNEKKGLTFARGLRSILRHDPDKIMVGEIRDQETAQIAINSALTGHLVFTTVHA